MRKFLVGVQFTISIVLIISILIIQKQTSFALSKSMVDKNNHILCLNHNNYEVMQKYEEFKLELEKNPIIDDVTAIMECPPREIKDAKGFECKSAPEVSEGKMLYVLPTDDNFIDFYNLNLLAGKCFASYKYTLDNKDFILNEKAIKLIGWENPEDAIGNDFRLLLPNFDTVFSGKIVGAVKNFHFSSLHREIQPLVIFQEPKWYFNILVKYNPINSEQALQLIEEAWIEMFNEYPFEYSFLEDEYEAVYSKELSSIRLLSVFVVFMLLISVLGLFALTAIIAERRTKEIAIRKVNGAGVGSVLRLFSVEFQKIVALAFVVAIPVTYYITKLWMESFLYQTETGWWYYIVGFVVAVFVVQFTIMHQCFRVARRNPVVSLRAE